MKNYAKKVIDWVNERIIPKMTNFFKHINTNRAESFLTSLALFLICIWFVTFGKLVETQYVVQEKVRIIKEQGQTIEKYKTEIKTLTLPGKTKVVRVTDQQLRTAINRANREAQELRQEKIKYQRLAQKYSRPNPKAASPSQRVRNEEAANDQFIKDWKK